MIRKVKTFGVGIFQMGFLFTVHCDIVGWPNFVMRMLAARAYRASSLAFLFSLMMSDPIMT